MKFLQYNQWTHYLQIEAKKHLMPLYGIVCSDNFERNKLTNILVKALFNKEYTIQKLDLEKTELNTVISELQSLSLFSKQRLLIIENLETHPTKEQKTLIEECKHLTDGTHVLLSLSQNLPTLRPLHDKMSLLDLSKEKPWDTKKRYTSYIQNLLHRAKKKIQPQALELFVQHMNDSYATWETEIQKVIAYALDDGCIQTTHIKDIVTKNHELAQWKLAEKLLYEPADYKRPQHVDMAMWFGFIAALRYNLQMGYTLIQQIQNNQPLQFGKTSPSYLSRIAPLSKKNPQSFYPRALQELFLLELHAKEHTQNARHLYDTIEILLHTLRQNETYTTYNSTRII